MKTFTNHGAEIDFSDVLYPAYLVKFPDEEYAGKTELKIKRFPDADISSYWEAIRPSTSLRFTGIDFAACHSDPDDESMDDDVEDNTTDLKECGMHYDDGHNFACELIGTEQCEFCQNRR